MAWALYGVVASLDAQQPPAGVSWDREDQVRGRDHQSAEDQQRSARCGELWLFKVFVWCKGVRVYVRIRLMEHKYICVLLQIKRN